MKILIFSFLTVTTLALLSGCSPQQKTSFSRLSIPAKLEISERPSTKKNSKFVPIFRYDFGTVPSKDPLVTAFTLQNSGETPATQLKFSIDVKNFHISNYCGSTLPPLGKGTCQIIIIFVPDRDGNFPATLTVSYNNGQNQPQTFKFLINGNSTQKYDVQPSPSSTPSPTATPTATPSPTPTGPAACNGDKVPLNSQNGVVARIEACPQVDLTVGGCTGQNSPDSSECPRNVCNDRIKVLSDFDKQDLVDINEKPIRIERGFGTVFLTRPYLPADNFLTGFKLVDGNGPLKVGGLPVVEFFRLTIFGYIQPQETDDISETYSFKLNSDDGSSFYVGDLGDDNPDIEYGRTNKPTEFSIDSKIIPYGMPPGIKYYRFATCDRIASADKETDCSPSDRTPVRFKHHKAKLPFILQYFQGPRANVALFLSWKKASETWVAPHDGWYSDLIPRDQNFRLPSGDNPCTQ